MVKLNCINQKACFINWVLQFYLYQNYVFHYFLDSILMVLLKFNQNHLQFIFIFIPQNIISSEMDLIDESFITRKQMYLH